MKSWVKKGCISAFLLACLFPAAVIAAVKEGDTIKTGSYADEFNLSGKDGNTIKTGIYADEINLSGMNGEEATQAIQAYVGELAGVELTLLAAADTEVTVTAGELGIVWANPDLVGEALEVGTRGNVIERYKILKDLQYDNLVYPIDLSFDTQAIHNILQERCTQYDREAVNATLTREDGQFHVTEGSAGYTLNVEASADSVLRFLTEEWNRGTCDIALDMTVTEPQGSAEALAQVTDVLGTYTTSYASSNSHRSTNIETGCGLINGMVLYPGEEFSTYEAVGPFTAERGYEPAGSYLNGKVVDSLGGGICQVSTTLYNAVLLAELEVTQRSSHSMIVTYVELSSDAAITEGAGKDFRFVNNLEYPIYIEGAIGDKSITFTIYGKETRAANREIRYESVVLETNKPSADDIFPDSSHPIGYIVTDGAHIGYKAQLWKIVLEDGVEVSRTQVNSSSYKMVPRSATVGTATGDPSAYEEIMAAIGTGNIEHVRNVIAVLTAPPAEPSP